MTSNVANDSAAAADANSDHPVASASPPPAAAVFSDGEKVLAYHGPRIYEAKVQKAELRKDEARYYVHYLGWSKNWDEWVGVERLLKLTDENIHKMHTLEKDQNLDKNAKSIRTVQNKPRGPSDAKMDKDEHRNHGLKIKKRKGHPGTEEKKSRPSKKIVIFQFPLTLKKQLADDWEFVTQLGKLVKLPRSPNVDDILKKYLDYRTKKDGMITDSVAEILKGLRCYFDKALPAILLYKKEREQYDEVVRGDTSPSTVYGAEHLLRLFVKLPELLAYVNLEEETQNKLQQKLMDFLRFLQKNQSTFFLSTYEGPRDEDDMDS